MHGAVVDDHLFVFDERVVFGGVACAFEEEPIDEFHDVGFVDDGNFLASTKVGKFECILHKTFGIELGSDFEGLHDARVDFVFYA